VIVHGFDIVGARAILDREKQFAARQPVGAREVAVRRKPTPVCVEPNVNSVASAWRRSVVPWTTPRVRSERDSTGTCLTPSISQTRWRTDCQLALAIESALDRWPSRRCRLTRTAHDGEPGSPQAALVALLDQKSLI
jgi:hypothetical protein